MTALIIAIALLTAGLLCLLFIDRNQERRLRNTERTICNMKKCRDEAIEKECGL